MRFCPNCGEEIIEGTRFCPHCGHNLSGVSPTNTNTVSGDAPSTGYAVLSAIIPIVGLILYLVWKDDYPLRAKSCGKGALIGVIISIVLGTCTAIASSFMGYGYY
ncbi:MAG: zinc-ribbon domain-containing protein [Acholeplasmataceae bacterium]|nr:zinc-ribbon domain-containing protein [Acholeplasmataceae bacterium]